LRDGSNLNAVKALQSATKEDTEFALAYSRLAEAESALGYDAQAEQDSRKAVELSQNLPLAQKYFINASLARVTKNNSKAIEEYENLAKRMPDNSDVERSLGGLYTDTGQYDKARIQLSKLLQAEPKNPRVLWQMGALEIMSGNTEAAFDPLNKGLSVAVQTDNQEAKALILHAIGVAYRLSNKPQDALDNYQQSLAIDKRLGQKWGMAASLSEMAQAYSLLGKPDKTLASLKQTLSLEQEIGAKKEAGDTLIDLGNFYDDRGRHDQALQMYKESLQIQRDSGDENYQALCLNSIGDTYFSKGQYQDALTYFQQALTLREKLKLPGAIASTVQSLAETNVRLGQYDQAAALYLRALDLYRSAGDKRGAAAGSGKLATLFIYKGRYGAAVKSSEDAVQTFRDLKEKSPVMAQMLSAYGDALAESGRIDEAQKVLDEALGLARELNSQDVLAEVFALQAKAALYRGDFGSAQALYTQSLNFASRTKNRENMVVSRIGLAKVDAAKGRAREAVASFKSLGLEADRLGSMYLSTECAVGLGEALIGTKDYARTRQALESALHTSEKLGMRTLQVRAHYLLGTILRLSGNSSEASGQYQQALSLLEEIRKEPGAENVLHRADLGSLYEDATRWVRQTKTN
jgi:tetratricopeptide (TPR) repeat protein